MIYSLDKVNEMAEGDEDFIGGFGWCYMCMYT